MNIIVFILAFLLKFSNSTKSNVLLIIVDDLRPALGVYRDPNAYTPNIDALARRSFVFNNAYAQQSLCAPSRNSFLTSRRPDSLRLYDFYSYWRDVVGNFTTLPQHFKQNGYYTHSIGKVFHPGISSNFTDDQPYSWSRKPFHPYTQKFKDAKVCMGKSGKRQQNIICPVRLDDQPGGTLPDVESTSEAVNFLRKLRKSDRNFFLAVGLHKPHIPLKYPRKYLKYHPYDEIVVPKYHYKPPLMPTVAWNPWTDLRKRDDIRDLNVSFPFGRMPVSVTRSIIQSYAAATSYIDDLIGVILNNVPNNTIIVLIGDHGVSMGEHGEFSKYSNFDIATRVPLIIHVPNLTNKTVSSKNMVELVDLFPTLVELTEVSEKIPQCDKNGTNCILCTEGKSLVPHMMDLVTPGECNNDDEKSSAAFSQYPRPGIFPTMRPNSDKPRLTQIKIMGYSIRTPEFRYTEWVEFDHVKCKPNWDNVQDKELYYHVIDPDENMNLSNRTELCDIMARLRKRLIMGWRHKAV